MKKFIFLILISAFLNSCTSTGKTLPSDLYKNESAHTIYDKAHQALQNKSYGEASKRFEALTVQYPDVPEAENAQYYLTYSYFMKDEFALANSAADRFIKQYPRSTHAPHVLYIKALSNYYQYIGMLDRLFATDLSTRDLGQAQKSYQDFDILVKLYPTSPYAPHAHQYMIFLRNQMANHELEAARFYYSKGAYVASANRASEVISHYQGSPSVRDALIILAQSYYKLKSMRYYQDTVKVIQYNYPGTVINLAE